MAKIHILAGNTANLYTAVVHATVPAGNNAAGTPWADAIKNSGNATTIMTVGTGPGQITQAEANQILAGTVIEAVFVFQDDPTKSNAERLAYVDTVATQSVNELLARLSAELKLFGLTRN